MLNTECMPCSIPPNKYFPPLGGDCGDSSKWVGCDVCTDPLEYGSGLFLNGCPALDNTKGRAANGIACMPCLKCDSGYYVKVDPKAKCVTDKAVQCVYNYRGLDGVNVKNQPMPFIWGRKRMPGVYNTQTYLNNEGAHLFRFLQGATETWRRGHPSNVC